MKTLSDKLITAPIEESDVQYIKSRFKISPIDLFKDDILKTSYKGVRYYFLPFISFDGKVKCSVIFNINFKKPIARLKNTFWTALLNEENFNPILFIGDDPLTLMKFYSDYSNDFKGCKIQFVVPSIVTYESIKLIKEKYLYTKVITVFESISHSCIQKIITSAVFAEKPFSVSRSNCGGFTYTSNTKEFTSDDVRYSEMQKVFRFQSVVRHRVNKRNKITKTF